MAKNKYVLLGTEIGAAMAPVMKELATYQGDALKLEGGFVTVIDNEVEHFTVAVIRLAEGQSVKRKE